MEAILGEILSFGSLKNVSFATRISCSSRSVNETFCSVEYDDVGATSFDESTFFVARGADSSNFGSNSCFGFDVA